MLVSIMHPIMVFKPASRAALRAAYPPDIPPVLTSFTLLRESTPLPFECLRLGGRIHRQKSAMGSALSTKPNQQPGSMPPAAVRYIQCDDPQPATRGFLMPPLLSSNLHSHRLESF